ncbi:pseudoazurin [Bombella intestini]|uniref:Pseudoazurin n=1 Tax=Bombella intestini TaxID=1539051 RepID=A0A1S8GND8_9PROT|nr:pseudoazurin [Bombella intestini]OOL17364.1 pseudoazurin [Bombella intestini]
MLKFAGGAFALFMATALSATAATVDVQMLNHGTHRYSFEPAVVYIHSGDSVHFVPTDKGHNVQSIPGMTPDGAEPINVPFSQEKTVQFTKSGLYGYKCLPHVSMGMVGLIVVDNANNEAQARKVTFYGKAKQRFDELFQDVDSKKGK